VLRSIPNRRSSLKPTIVMGYESGYHNSDLEAALERIADSKQYKNCSTVILTPTRGMIPARVVTSWMFLIGPANAQLGRLFVQSLEVGSAYNSGITTILNDPSMTHLRYILTLEDDNIPPNDGLIQLYEGMCGCEVPCKEHYTVVGGLYWMKGEMGQPMIFGNPDDGPTSFTPQVPRKDSLQECNGVGMGFTLFHKGLFELPELPKPWFVTEQKALNSKTMKAYTQDLYFMERLRKEGYRIACNTSVKVGHYDIEQEKVW
jgi:hypothetical protein